MPLARGQLLAMGVVLVVAAGSAGVAAFAATAAAPTAPRSVGVVPWSDAVDASADARTVTVQAQVEPIARRLGCDELTARPTVTESESSVAIQVEIIDHAARTDTICDASLRVAIPVRVHLHAPLGDRRLVDGADRRRHAVRVLLATPCP